jgi:hypothetical protein
MYATAVSAILTFTTGSLFVAPKQLAFDEKLSHFDELEYAIQLPRVVVGPGAADSSRSMIFHNTMYPKVQEFITDLFSCEYDIYFSVMRSVRLFQLSVKNHPFDFGTAYLLLVSSIESIAQLAVSRDDVKEGHDKEAVWKKLANEDPDIKELLIAYKAARGQNSYLKERYWRFIYNHAPVASWDEYVVDPWLEYHRLLQESTPWELPYHSQYEKDIRPSRVPIEHLEEFIKDAYTHRSNFVHTGKQPPHEGRNALFFEDTWVFNGKKVTSQRILLPTYRFMIAIAQNSIAGFLHAKALPKKV